MKQKLDKQCNLSVCRFLFYLQVLSLSSSSCVVLCYKVFYRHLRFSCFIFRGFKLTKIMFCIVIAYEVELVSYVIDV